MCASQTDRVVLLVDDDPLVLKLLSMILTTIPSVRFLTAQTSEEALRLALSQPVQMVITDMNMPGKTGAWLLQQLKTNGINVPVIMHSGSLDPQDEPEVMRLGASRVLRKPASASVIVQTITDLLEQGQGQGASCSA